MRIADIRSTKTVLTVNVCKETRMNYYGDH